MLLEVGLQSPLGLTCPRMSRLVSPYCCTGACVRGRDACIRLCVCCRNVLQVSACLFIDNDPPPLSLSLSLSLSLFLAACFAADLRSNMVVRPFHSAYLTTGKFCPETLSTSPPSLVHSAPQRMHAHTAL